MERRKKGSRYSALLRLVPVAIFVVLGMSIVAFVSAGTPTWAQSVGPAGTLPIIEGTVHLQGRPAPPAPPWSVPLVVTLHDPGNLTPAYTYNVTTDASGHFTFTHAVSGTYVCDIRVKNSHTLRNVKSNVTLVPDGNALDFGTLREGDANNDNYVSLIDFSILATTYDKGSGQAGFDPRADFNENDWIEIADFSLLATNYDTHGDFPAAMTRMTADEPVTLTLKLEPSFWVVPQGEIFTVDMRLDPKAQPFQGVAAYLDFDPAELEVVDALGNPATEITPGGELTTIIANTVDNTAGTIAFSAGVLGGATPAEEFSVATIRFKAKQINMTGSQVQFVVQDYPPKTGVTHQGYYLPLELTDLRVRIGYTRLLFPMVMSQIQTLPPVE